MLVFPYFCTSKMNRKALLILVFLILTVSLFFCGRRCSHHKDVVINTDSLFFNLNKEIVDKRAKMADNVFSNMSRAGLNGVVLYRAEDPVRADQCPHRCERPQCR